MQIKKFHPDFSEEKLDKEELYRKIYPGKSYSDSTMRDLFSELLKISQQFLVLESLQSNELDTYNYLHKELRQRNLNSLLERSLQKCGEILDNTKGVDSEYFLLKYRFDTDSINYHLTNNKITNIKTVRKHIDEIKQSELNMLVHVIMEVVSDYMSLIISTLKFNISGIAETTDKILDDFHIAELYNLLRGKIKYNFILEIYMALLKTFKNFDSANEYKDYKKLVNKHIVRLSHDEISFHYSNLINYCIMSMNKKDSKHDYAGELFKLYRAHIKKEYYRNNKTEHLPYELYRAILLHAVSLKKTNWLYDFIAGNTKKLNPKYRVNMSNYANAHYFFEVNDYDKSLGYLNKLELTYFIFKYDVYILKLKIYLERENMESALNLVHSFRGYLKNDEMLPDNRKLMYTNFLYYLEKLILFREGKKIDIHFHRNKLQKLQNISSKDWLNNKFDQFLNKQKMVG